MEIKSDEFDSIREYYEFKHNIREALKHLQVAVVFVSYIKTQVKHKRCHELIEASYDLLNQMNFKE